MASIDDNPSEKKFDKTRISSFLFFCDYKSILKESERHPKWEKNIGTKKWWVNFCGILAPKNFNRLSW